MELIKTPMRPSILFSGLLLLKIGTQVTQSWIFVFRSLSLSSTKVIQLLVRFSIKFLVSRTFFSFYIFLKVYLIGSIGFYTSLGHQRLDQDRIHTERKKVQRKEKRQEQGIKPPQVQEEETDDYLPGEY
jgi:hypothetical protein